MDKDYQRPSNESDDYFGLKLFDYADRLLETGFNSYRISLILIAALRTIIIIFAVCFIIFELCPVLRLRVMLLLALPAYLSLEMFMLIKHIRAASWTIYEKHK